MSDALSCDVMGWAEINAQQVELLPSRTVLSAIDSWFVGGGFGDDGGTGGEGGDGGYGGDGYGGDGGSADAVVAGNNNYGDGTQINIAIGGFGGDGGDGYGGDADGGDGGEGGDGGADYDF